MDWLERKNHHHKNHKPQTKVLLFDDNGKQCGILWFCAECQTEQGIPLPDIKAMTGIIQK